MGKIEQEIKTTGSRRLQSEAAPPHPQAWESPHSRLLSPVVPVDEVKLSQVYKALKERVMV